MEDFEKSISEDSDGSVYEDDDCHIYEDHFQYKDMKKPVSLMGTLGKGLRLIFAEDLVSFIASEFYGLAYTSKINRNSKYSILNETIKRAVLFLRWQIHNINDKSFGIIGKLSKSNKHYYGSFVDAVLCHYSEFGLKAETLLCLCVYLTELALNCHIPKYEEMLDFAVYAILDAFSIYDDGMYELNNLSEMIVCKVKDRTSYPDYNPSWLTESEDLTVQDETYQDKCFRKYFSSLKDEAVNTKTALELKFIGESNKYDLASILRFVVNNIEAIKSPNSDGSDIDSKNEAMDFQTASEQKLPDRSKCDFKSILEFLENNDELIKFNVSGKDDKDSSVISRDSIVSLIDEIFCTSCKKIPSSSETKFSEDFVQEVMSIVNLEAMLFSEIYLSSENPSVSLKENIFQKIDENGELSEGLNIQLQNLDFMPEKLSRNSVKSEAGTLQSSVVINMPFIQQGKEGNSDHISCYNDEKVLNNETESMDFEQNMFASENHTHNNKSSNKLPTEKVTELKTERSPEDSDFIPDNITVKPDDCNDQKIVEILAVYKREGEVSEKNLNVLKGESLLFAEDIVRYISKEFYDVSYSGSKFQEIRDCWWNPFNEAVKEVTRFIHNESAAVNEVVFDLIDGVKEHRTDCYRKYVASILSHYIQEDLNSDAFLYYCWHFSEIATKLYGSNLPEILDFAVYSILDAFCCLKDDWNEFSLTVEKTLKLFKARASEQYNCKRPRYTDDFERECVVNIFDSLKEITRFRS